MKTQLEVMPMKMPNFVTAVVLGQEIKLDVGALSSSDVAGLWDEWKELWLDHCTSRRKNIAAIKEGPVAPDNGEAK